VTVDLDETDVILALIESGRLSESEALDPHAVAAALGEVVAEWSAALECARGALITPAARRSIRRSTRP